MIYLFIKLLSSLALPFYFCKWQISGKEKIPGGPVIFVANHRNAFLDAVLIACSSSKNPWFITRADVFRKPFVKKMLSVLQMVPVYRFRDGFGSMKQNGEVISSCVAKLNSGQSILIFPEGNHGTRHHIRPLQKGFARIAFSETLSVKPLIVPVGIYFESLSGFRSRVLISFGDPVDASVYKTDSQLLPELSQRLQSLTLHIDHDRYDEILTRLQKKRIISDDLTEQLGMDQRMVQNLTNSNHSVLSNQDEESKNNKDHIFRRLTKNYIKANLFPASMVIHRFILSKIEDPQFKGSVKFSAGMFLVPVFLMMQSLILYFISGNPLISIAYFISVPLSVKMVSKNRLN
jgi:1-acyl-sn-glycerol-3-phosphate acyltransferase